ncbi:MAG: ABC transporter ATP-binding protein [Candidatus Eremiobacteraeota bacterium]|nr:ABC transporter ATP-binding protein [Candidatus Eremiobacteraeota bacterium]
MGQLEVKDLDFRYGRHEALRSVTLCFEGGLIHGVLGPNGSGKSTLLRLLAGVAAPARGEVACNGAAVSALSPRQRARLISFVPQDFYGEFPFPCRDFVMMGRFAHQGALGFATARDEEVVRQVMAFTGTRELADRAVTALSGGELQRVMVAQALAQEASILLLDEPTSHLDIRYQLELMELLKKLNREQGITIITSLHDLNLASAYCSRLVFLSHGEVRESGPVEQVFTGQIIEEVFGVSVRILSVPGRVKPVLLYGTAADEALPSIPLEG